MLSLRLLNAEKVHSSVSIHVSLGTSGPLVLVEGWGGGKDLCVCVGGGVWVVPDSEKATLSTVRNHKRATVILVCFQNVSSSDVLRMKAIITLHPTKYILASCPVKPYVLTRYP